MTLWILCILEALNIFGTWDSVWVRSENLLEIGWILRIFKIVLYCIIFFLSFYIEVTLQFIVLYYRYLSNYYNS